MKGDEGREPSARREKDVLGVERSVDQSPGERNRAGLPGGTRDTRERTAGENSQDGLISEHSSWKQGRAHRWAETP